MKTSDPLTKLARAFFLLHVEQFLNTPPEELQKLCRAAGVTQDEFICACEKLQQIAKASAERKRLN